MKLLFFIAAFLFSLHPPECKVVDPKPLDDYPSTYEMDRLILEAYTGDETRVPTPKTAKAPHADAQEGKASKQPSLLFQSKGL